MTKKNKQPEKRKKTIAVQKINFDSLSLEDEIRFANHVILERGILNSAIFDFTTGRVLSLNYNATLIAKKLEEGINKKGLFQWWQNSGNSNSKLIDFCQTLCNYRVLAVNEPKRIDSYSHRLDRCVLPIGLKFLWIEVTGNCNLRCVHCYRDSCSLSKAQLNSQQYVTTKDITNLITDSAKFGCKKIQFTGGEPLLHPHLKQMILHAKNEEFSFIEVYTNGTLINDSIVDFFKENCIHVAISFYSLWPNVHENITKRSGSYDATLFSIKKLLDRKIHLRIGIIVMKQNENHITETKRFLRKNGFSGNIRVDCIRPCGRGENNENKPIRYDCVRRSPMFMAHWRSYAQSHNQNSCWYGKLAITSSGDALPCIFSRDIILGNVRDQTLSEIIKSSHTQKLWHITHDQIEECNVCEYRYVCRDCRALSLNTTGRLLDKSPRCAYDPYTGKWIPKAMFGNR